jgi:hypothetical protein
MSRKRTREGWWIVVVVAGLCASSAPLVARAADPARASGDRGRNAEGQLGAEAARLRQELERTNADISALKRSGPGVRNDYRLQRRQADAEQLARKLTAIEAQLRALRAGSAQRPVPPVLDEAAEAPAALEARADLLSDEARRLSQQASGLARAAGELRSRQTLLRRSGQIERDPFGSMDASKRFMVLQGSTPTRGVDRAGQRPTTPENATGVAPGDSRGSQPVPPTPPAPPPPPAGLVPGNPATGTPPPAPPVATGGSTSPPGPITPTQPVTTLSGNSVGDARTAPRALLDPAALGARTGADRAAGKPISEIEKLERAAAELTSRAQALEAEARGLRSRAAKR